MEFINRKEFAKAALNKNVKAFIIYVTLFMSKITIHIAQKARIILLTIKKINILEKPFDFSNFFLKKLAEVFSKYTRINKNVSKLK